uniref:Aminotransferase-like plant mobile domain-containing protein n=1 Tax=Solanum lycopersicum TaxID=4081 RepID=A0A3Q7JKB5_SOLLC
MILNTRKYYGKFSDLVNEHPIHPRVLDVIKLSELYAVINRSLITALVERWRPETQTFHFRMNHLAGRGDTVWLTHKDNPIVRYETQSLKISVLNPHLKLQPRLPDLATHDMDNEKTRCYMFWMIAGLLLADTSSASESTQNEIARFLPLLQIWTWKRVTVLRPHIVAQRDTKNIFPGPHATRWFAHFSWTDTTKHVLRVFRDALDSMIEAQVHLPNRVMRQFGLLQAISSSFLFDAIFANFVLLM